MTEQDPTVMPPGDSTAKASPSQAAETRPAEARTVAIPPRRREQKPLNLHAATRQPPASTPVAASATSDGVPSAPAESQGRAIPKHQRLNRRVVMLTDAQEAGLAQLTRRLMEDPRRGAVPGAARERISDAVLVRTAIDLLLRDHADALGCITEDDLRASVGLPPLGS